MTKREKIISRIIIARSVGLCPDDIQYVGNMQSIEEDDSEYCIFSIENFKGYRIEIVLKEVPTIEEAREDIKEMYLILVEMDFHEEFYTTK